MCSVTFSPRKRGYALAMNRDEKLSRVAGLPPAKRVIRGRSMLSPSEPGGGTWIALNGAGVAFALINWYSIPATVERNFVSRGEVVPAAGVADSPAAASVTLEKLPLKRMNPFRLIGVFPATQQIFEWRWNLRSLVRTSHRWRMQQWISSGFDELTAQRVRSKTFRRALNQESAGRLDWLRRLHRSHLPEAGPFSTCMHRADAATVSYAEITVSAHTAAMRYFAGAPCQCSAGRLQSANLTRP